MERILPERHFLNRSIMDNTTRKWISAFIAAICICLTLTGCIDGGLSRRAMRQTRLHFQIIEEDGATRSSWFGGESIPDDILVLFYHTDGRLAKWIAPGDGIDINGNYTLDEVIVDCDYYIYALAGCGIDTESIAATFGTISDARDFTIFKSRLQTGIMPYAHIPENAVHLQKGDCCEIGLERLLAKYCFALDMSGMNGTFTATSISVRQSPLWTRPLVSANCASGPAELSNGDSATSEDIATFNEGGLICFYLMENCQGETNSGNDDPWMKVPDNMNDGKGALASYVEVCGNYAGDNVTVSGLRYRFFLGDDEFSNCDVRRNTAHTVILHLTDENTVLKESWKIVRGDVEDNRTLTLSSETIDVFPYPTRRDTVSFSFSPANLNLKVSLDSSRLADYPFSVSVDGNRLIIASERFLQDDAATLTFPICIGTRDNVRKDTLKVAYYSLDDVWPYKPFDLYSNFSGSVIGKDGIAQPALKNTFTDRSANSCCFKVDLNYNGVIKSCWSDPISPDKDSVFERGLVLSSSDPDIISTNLSPTNPTLWYLKAENPGTARITATYTMGETIESGFVDYTSHLLSIVLNVRSSIGRNESCEPEVELYNETGERFLPYNENQVQYFSSDTFILSNEGIGLNNGTTQFNVRYGFSDEVTDSREVTVSGSDNRYELYILPAGQESLYPGEVRELTARCRHYLNGSLISDEPAFCLWRNSDNNIAHLNSEYGESVTVTGVTGNVKAAVIRATYYGSGFTCSAEKKITVMKNIFFSDCHNLLWASSEYGSDAARSIELTATSALGWTASLSGSEAEFFSLSSTSGTGSATIKVFPVSENKSRTESRGAVLIISAEGMQSQTVFLRQATDTTSITPIPDPGPGPDPGPDPGPGTDPVPVIHDTTSVLSISPSGTTTIPHHGTCQYSAYLQMYIDGSVSGSARDVTAEASWHTSKRYVAEIDAGLAQGCNGTPDAESTVITATFDGLTSNEAVLTVGGLIRTQYLELTPSAPQTIEADGSTSYTLLLHTVTDGIDDGGVDMTLSAEWTSSNTNYARAAGGTATGCNMTYEQQRVVISAHHSNLTAQVYLYVKGLSLPEPETHTLTISTTKTLYYLDRDALGETITVLYDGQPVNDASAISWHCGNGKVINGVQQFRPALCGLGMGSLYASYNGETSNSLNYEVRSRITSVRLKITALTLQEGNADPVSWQSGIIPAGTLSVLKTTFVNGESGIWCNLHGGTFYDTDAELTVAIYITDVELGEYLLTTKTFPFSVMRGDLIDFTSEDWKGFIDRKYFDFTARIVGI